MSMMNLPLPVSDQFMEYGMWLSILNSGWEQTEATGAILLH